ncbi:hypothetical protein EKO27_g11782 [Xylaria grammica]|uniref:Uncharacterized protein n=1 Tax=Xylaria grammica TaxID=363999 RepID=A0A439CMC8_9PEZI|nr:hypothetical protein EKO27_g11782 [Xylaria grammica]
MTSLSTGVNMQNEASHVSYKHLQCKQKQNTTYTYDYAYAYAYTNAMALHEYIDPPPSYAEATASSTRRHTAASTSSAALNPIYSHGSTPMFPRAFAVYTQSPRHYVLGESQSAPRYAVSTHSSLSSRPDVVIHSGVSQDSTYFPTQHDGTVPCVFHTR